jgi:hypothetical protein
MTAPAFNAPSNTTPITHRPALDTLVEGVAKGLLAWSDRRANERARTTALTHERMALILENRRRAPRGGSSLDR